MTLGSLYIEAQGYVLVLLENLCGMSCSGTCWLLGGAWFQCRLDFPGGSDGKASAYNTGDPGSIPGSGRSPGEGNGNPLQYSCLESSMDGQA